ncbi:MAG: hypothetical protein HC819_18575 [Cyclobacteriaceae bacterium]|nr:hypothetical protein [Cyclobacteriaceae bacterium]
MLTVEEATEWDFEQVHSLLLQLNSSTISRETWQKTFESPYNSEGPPGFILKDVEQVVGFLGTIFQKGLSIAGRSHFAICTVGSWMKSTEETGFCFSIGFIS